jgi:hypothetical protein
MIVFNYLFSNSLYISGDDTDLGLTVNRDCFGRGLTVELWEWDAGSLEQDFMLQRL